MYKKIIIFGIILIFVGASFLPNVSGNIIDKKDGLNEIVRFQVYEFKDGKCKKIIKEMPINTAYELKEKMDIISKNQVSLYDTIEMKISLLKEYNLIPKDASMEKIILENKGISKSKSNIFIKESKNLDVNRNFIGTIDFETSENYVGLTFALGSHSLLPSIGLDLGLMSIGDFYVKTTGLLGSHSDYHCKLGFVVGFVGFLIIGFLGVYFPYVSGLGVYLYSTWIN